MNQRSKASLFLLEQLIVILVFALCAAACVKIFVVSYTMVNDARDISDAILAVESGAECYKAMDGDAARIAELLGGESGGANNVTVYYDANWTACSEQESAYILTFTGREHSGPASLRMCDLSVRRNGGGQILAITAAAGVESR